MLVSIDGGPTSNVSYNDPSPQSTRRWYQSPTLPSTNHSIIIDHLAEPTLDFVVITAGETTPLSGQKLIVDDNDAAFTYEGDWSRNTDPYKYNDYPMIGIPFGNATHRTTTPGASATFKFSGTSSTDADIIGT